MQEFHHPSTHFTGCLPPIYGVQHPVQVAAPPIRGAGIHHVGGVSTAYRGCVSTPYRVSALRVGGSAKGL